MSPNVARGDGDGEANSVKQDSIVDNTYLLVTYRIRCLFVYPV
jgi:hypothetical protein